MLWMARPKTGSSTGSWAGQWKRNDDLVAGVEAVGGRAAGADDLDLVDLHLARAPPVAGPLVAWRSTCTSAM